MEQDKLDLCVEEYKTKFRTNLGQVEILVFGFFRFLDFVL